MRLRALPSFALPFALVLVVPLLLAMVWPPAADVDTGALPMPVTGQGPTGASRFVQTTDAGYPLVAPAPGPDGYRPTVSGVVNFTDLAANGLGQSFKLTATCYLCEVFDEAVTMCQGALTCATGGTRMGVGTIRKICADQTATGGVDAGVTTDWSGRSTSGTGDWVCTPTN